MQTVGIGCELQLFPGASVVPKFNSFSLWRPGGVHTCFQFLLLSSPPYSEPYHPPSCPSRSIPPCTRTLLSRPTWLLLSEHHPTASFLSVLMSPCSLQQDRVAHGRSRLPLPFCPQGSPVCKGLTTTCQVSPSEMSNCQLLSGHTGTCLIIKLFMKLQS